MEIDAYLTRPKPEKDEFCRYCGASIPHRTGEGRCQKCIQHLPLEERIVFLHRVLREALTDPGAACYRTNTPAAYRRRLEAVNDAARNALILTGGL